MNYWIRIVAEFDAAPADWSVFASAFDQFGCPGSLQSDMPPQMSAYLADSDATSEVIESLSSTLIALGANNVHTERVADEDWSSIWKLHFKPIRIGQRFIVRPTWETFDLQASDCEIVLDPGQAFGTGDHPTTKLCIEILEKYASDKTSKLLDLGTGSGILAIAAKKLGVQTVEATDIDPIAVEVCKANCAANACDVEAFCATGFDDQRLDSKWPIIVSNIISATLIRLAPEASKRLSDGGYWIVSGIIETNWLDVETACNKCGLDVMEVRRDSGWVGAVLQSPMRARVSSR